MQRFRVTARHPLNHMPLGYVLTNYFNALESLWRRGYLNIRIEMLGANNAKLR